MKTPSFWYIQSYRPGPLWRIAAFIYGLARRLHVAITRPATPDIPVICIGNVTAGGTGKTPITQAIIRLLNDQSPVTLLRGYGATDPGPRIVTPDDAPITVGDEALIHASNGPTIIARDRYQGTKAIKNIWPNTQCIVMDDGLQNRQITPTCNILVIDGAVGFGNGYLMPAGPLREPLRDALSRTDLCIIVGDDQTNARTKIQFHHADMPIFTARLMPDLSNINMNRRYVAVAGIGRPQKFFDTLTQAGLDVVETHPLPDHYSYQKPDVTDLFERARHQHAALIATEKDAVKIRALTDQPFDVLKVQAVFDAPDAVRQTILEKIKSL